MKATANTPRRRAPIRLLVGLVVAAAALGLTAPRADAATTASFGNGVLSVFGDAENNAITVSRNAAGQLLVNGGAVPVVGGASTVANTSRIQAFGLGGNDTITLDQANGALPAANLFGGADNDVVTGGAGNDQLFGQAGNDTLLGKGGFDFLFGGSENDTLTGGDADDQAFGQGGGDRMIWNPGDDTDLDEGGEGPDTVEVNGGNGAEQFTATANGARVRFDRLNPAPFSIDVGTSETLVLNANGGSDSFSATGNLAALIRITVDGGSGGDSILGSNGIDVLRGGADNDFVDGQQGNDVAFLGSGDDTFQWDPGDGSDVVEGHDGTDRLLFNGSAASERLTASANGGRVLFTRDVGNILMDLDDVESIVANALGGTDLFSVNDVSGTDLENVTADLAGPGGADDLAGDNVVVNATNGDDVVSVAGAGASVRVSGVAAAVSVANGIAGSDRLTVVGLAGSDVLDASGLSATAVLLTLDGREGDDILIGGDGGDVLLGGDGDDVLIGGPGVDTLDGGPGDNVVIDSFAASSVRSAAAASTDWLKRHVRIENGKTKVTLGGKERTLPRADLSQLVLALPSR